MLSLSNLGTRGQYKILDEEKLEAVTRQLRYNRKLGGHQLTDGLKYSNKNTYTENKKYER